MPDHSTAIAELTSLINSASTSISVDGLRTDFDLDAAERRLKKLLAEHDGDAETAARAPRSKMIPYRLR